MDALLNKLKDWKKIIYIALCIVFAFVLLCRFILDIDNDAGAITVIVDLLQNIFEGAILAAGLYGLLTGKDAFCRVAFALLLGSALYGLISGVLNWMWTFEYLDGARASVILYYVFSFITALVGTAFAVLVVLGWLLGKDDLKKYGGYCGVCWIGLTILMIIFTIVVVADDMMNWTNIIDSIYSVLFHTFVVILATSGVIAYEAVEAAAAPAAKKEAPAAKEEAPAAEPAAPAEEEKPAETTAE